MVRKLVNANEDVAKQIYAVFQRSYTVEAELIGIEDFPPLKRRVGDIERSTTQFYGYFESDSLAAVIEISEKNEHLDIDSLTVDPAYFRKGIANTLLSFVLDVIDYTSATVETAEVNEPAIRLYKKHGFTETKRWTPSHGIPKLALSIGVEH